MKRTILPLILILLLPIVTANLEITSPDWDNNVFVGVEKELEYQFKNTFTFPIYTLTFTETSYITPPTISVIEPNQTIKRNFTILPDEIFTSRTDNIIVQFWYYSTIDYDPVTYDINITDEKFYPNPITIQIRDSLKFNNNGSLTAVIVDDYNHKYFNNELIPNQSVTISTFNQVDDFFYHDLNDLTKVGRIIVQNASEELITNSDHNKVITFNYNSHYSESNLDIELYPHENYTIDYNGFQEISVRVWNTGSNTLYDVQLNTSSYPAWFSFQDNDFDLTPNQNRFITLRITPNVNHTDQTNKTYDINIIADASNSAPSTANIKLFIPFSTEIFQYSYGEDFWAGKALFCSQYPNAVECNAPPKTETKTEYIYINGSITLSKEDVMKNLRELNNKATSSDTKIEKNTKSINKMETRLTSIETNQTDLIYAVQESNEISKEAKKESEGMTSSVLLILIILVVAGIFTYLIIRARKKSNEELDQAFSG